jgi:PPM family protein phosphatase
VRFSLLQDSRKGARPYNQDRVGHRQAPEALLMALADGMGGYAGGERAAQLAVQSVVDEFAVEAKPRLADPEGFLSSAIGRAHGVITSRLGDAPRTTLVACVIQAGCAYWSHVGDSRLYLIREGKIAARTRDHTAVQQLIDAGRIREEAVASHPARNQLLRCLGGPAAPQLERTASASLARNDVVLLCSDGLWGPLTPRLLLMGFIGKEPARALPELMALAEARAGAGADNLSALALQWHG